jgi:hypothetical protein
MARTSYNSITIPATGGRAVYLFNGPGRVDIALIGSLGGGAASIQVSYEDTPNPATDAHWQTLNGATALATETVYPIEVTRCSALCVRLSTTTGASLVAVFA